MASGKIGSHNSAARPEQKMSRQHATPHVMNDGRVYGPYPKSAQRQVAKRDANAKRRRRDKTETET